MNDGGGAGAPRPADQVVAGRSKINATLQASIDALARSSTPAEVIPTVLQLVGSNFSAKSSAFFEVTPDGTVYGRYWLIEGRVYGPEELLVVDPVRYAIVHELARGFHVPESYLGKDSKEQLETVVLDHAKGTSVAQFDAFGRSVSWDLELNVPIVADHARVGALCIYRSAASPFTAFEVSLAESLAKQLGLAFAFAKLSERVRDATATLERERAERETAARARAVEVARAEEASRAEQERTALMGLAIRAMRRCASRLSDAREARAVTVEALRAAVEVLMPQGVMNSFVVELDASERLLRYRAFMREGVEVALEGPHFARDWSLDDPAMVTPWRRIASEAFVWGLTTDESVLHPDARALHEAGGAAAVAYVPLERKERVTGFVGFSLRGRTRPSSEQVWLLQALTTQISLALEMQRVSDEALASAMSREREAAAQRRANEVEKANEALRNALVTISNAPVERAPELMLLEVARAAGAAIAYWLEFDATARTLEVRIRVADGEVLRSVPKDDPDIFRAPFPADLTPGFAQLCATDAFVKMSTDADSELIWPGTMEWHRRNGRREAIAFVVRIGSVPVGVIGLAYRDRARLEEADEQLVRALTNQFALALQLSRLAKDSERSAIDRALAAELATANDAMRRAVDRLAKEPELESFLGFLLLEISRQLGTDTAAITPYFEDADAFRAGVVLTDGVVSSLGPMPNEVKLLDARFLERLLQSEGFAMFDVERDAALFWPGAVEFLRARGKRYSLSFAIRVDGRLFGQISLAYADEPRLSAQQTALVQALSTQAALAIQLTRLAQASRAAETAGAVAAERNRMAGEIHDSLAQSFTSIAMQSEALIADLDEHSPLRGTLEIIEETARIGLAEARASVLALRPIGDAVGELQIALGQLAERCNIEGTVTCEFRTSTEPCALSPDVRDAVLRVAQEAVSNAMRHANANCLVIEFDVHDGQAVLSVCDDGVGFQEDAPKSRTGFGLAGMRARAASLGGTLTVSANQQRGIAVVMSVPCHADGAATS